MTTIKKIRRGYYELDHNGVKGYIELLDFMMSVLPRWVVNIGSVNERLYYKKDCLELLAKEFGEPVVNDNTKKVISLKKQTKKHISIKQHATNCVAQFITIEAAIKAVSETLLSLCVFKDDKGTDVLTADSNAYQIKHWSGVLIELKTL